MKKIIHTISNRRKDTLNHIHRIEGQLQRLKQYIADDNPCIDIALLTTSIAKSFDGLQARTLEGFILNKVINKNISKTEINNLQMLIKLYKK